jgi:hypothetical protein
MIDTALLDLNNKFGSTKRKPLASATTGMMIHDYLGSRTIDYSEKEKVNFHKFNAC